MSKTFIFLLCVCVLVGTVCRADDNDGDENSEEKDNSTLLGTIAMMPINGAENAAIAAVEEPLDLMGFNSFGPLGLVGSIFRTIAMFMSMVFRGVSMIFLDIVPGILEVPGEAFQMAGDVLGMSSSDESSSTESSGLLSRRKRDIQNGTSISVFGEIEHGVAFAVKFIFGHVLDSVIAFVTDPDSIYKIFERLSAFWSTVRPMWEFCRKHVIPEVMEAMLRIENSDVISKSTKDKIEDIKDAYELLALLGYMPHLDEKGT